MSTKQLRPAGRVEPLGGELVGLASVGIGGLLLAAGYQLSNGRIGVPCLLHTLTGLNCPLCGSTRMAAAVFRGDLAAAWAFNAPVLLIGPVAAAAIGYQMIAWTLESLRLVRLPRIRISSRVQAVLTNVLVVGFLMFGVARNL